MVALLVGAAPLAQTPEPAQDNSINQDGSFNIEAIRTRANAGDVFDQEHLGYIYADGLEDVPQDDIEAVRWFRKAAEQGRVLAQYNLGVAYQLGIGVPQDDVEAIAWYRLAAEQGHANAQFNLGAMCSQGQGVPQDDGEAYKWFNLAATYADAEDREEFAEARDLTAERLTPEQRADAQRLAREFFEAHPPE